MDRRSNGPLFAFFGVLVLAVAALLAGLSYKDTLAAVRKSVDLYDESYDLTKVKDTDMVESSISMLFGQYANYSGDSYYVLPLTREDTIYYIGLKTSAENSEVLDDISSATLTYVYGVSDEPPEKVSIKGRLQKMDDRNLTEFRKWFAEQTLYDTESAGDENILAYYVGEEEDALGVDTFLCAVVGLVVGVVMLVKGIKMHMAGEAEAREQTHVVINGVSYSKDRFATVNGFIKNQQTIIAIQELSKITGVDLEQAEKIVRNWGAYYF